jgi:hypothetical protein
MFGARNRVGMSRVITVRGDALNVHDRRFSRDRDRSIAPTFSSALTGA